MNDLLPKVGKFGVKPGLGVYLTREGKTFEDPERYKRLVGNLNYLTVACPDIVHSLNFVSPYMSAPTIDY